MKQSIHFIAIETTYGSTSTQELVCADYTVGLVNSEYIVRRLLRTTKTVTFGTSRFDADSRD